MEVTTLNNYNRYCQMLKPEDIIFSFCLTRSDGSSLTITNNYVAYVLSAHEGKSLFAVDTKFAFIVRELALYALKSKFEKALTEIEIGIAEKITNQDIRKTIVLSDEGRVYRICAGNNKINEVYTGLDNKDSVLFFEEVDKKINDLLKKYDYKLE